MRRAQGLRLSPLICAVPLSAGLILKITSAAFGTGPSLTGPPDRQFHRRTSRLNGEMTLSCRNH